MTVGAGAVDVRARVVIAPDSFKGSLRAVDVARAIGDGWLSVRSDDEIILLPMADGGEGTCDALEAVMPGSRRMPLDVSGATGKAYTPSWLLVPDLDGPDADLGVVELASISSIELVAPDALRPLDASSGGFGEAIRAALDYGVNRLVLAIGSSASSDGGAGLFQALGAQVLDANGLPVPPGARGVARVASVDLSRMMSPPPGGVTVLTDVVSPLLGPEGAAAVFGPQKGATAADVATIEAALARWSTLISADAGAPGSGAAGGVGFALLAWGAVLVPGAQHVARLLELDAKVADATLVITGEGRFDDQSARGKAPSIVLAAAQRARVDAAVVAGSVDAHPYGVIAALSLTELAGGTSAAMARARHWLQRAGADLASEFGHSSRGDLCSGSTSRPVRTRPS